VTEKRRWRHESLFVIFSSLSFSPISSFFSSRQSDETPSFPNQSLKTLFRGWRRSKSLTFLAVWWIVKEKLAEHGSPPTLIYICRGREKDFKDHNWMSVLSSITDKKCKTSKRRRNFDSFWWW
jgi:hypothetical protein